MKKPIILIGAILLISFLALTQTPESGVGSEAGDCYGLFNGTVTSSDGQPIEGATVWVMANLYVISNWNERAVTTTNAEGYYQTPIIYCSGTRPDVYANKAGYDTQWVDARQGEHNLTLTLLPPIDITGYTLIEEKTQSQSLFLFEERPVRVDILYHLDYSSVFKMYFYTQSPSGITYKLADFATSTDFTRGSGECIARDGGCDYVRTYYFDSPQILRGSQIKLSCDEQDRSNINCNLKSYTIKVYTPTVEETVPPIIDEPDEPVIEDTTCVGLQLYCEDGAKMPCVSGQWQPDLCEVVDDIYLDDVGGGAVAGDIYPLAIGFGVTLIALVGIFMFVRRR